MKISKKIILVGAFLLTLTAIFFVISIDDKFDNTKRVDGLVITNPSITFDKSISVTFLTVNVKNKSKEKKEDVKLRITFINKSKEEIAVTTGFLGDIDSKQTIELNAAVSKELKNLYDIKYEILDN